MIHKNTTILCFLLLIAAIVLTITIVNNNRINKNLLSIKNDYSAEAIRHFYDCYFFIEFKDEERPRINKWKSDITISLWGSYSKEDSLIVSNTVNSINSLNLPIQASIQPTVKKSNLKITFDSYECNFHGKVTVNYLKRHIHDGQINIDNCVTGELRKEVIEEEIFQSLGLLGDSHSQIDSKFNQIKYKYSPITALDIEIIKILYDSRLNHDVTLSKFQNIFKEILQLELDISGLRKLSVEKNINYSFLKTFSNHAFDFNNRFFKWNFSKIPIYSNSLQNDSLQNIVQNEIEYINEIIGKKLLVIEERIPHQQDPGIHIEFSATESITVEKTLGLSTQRPSVFKAHVQFGTINKNYKLRSLLFQALCKSSSYSDEKSYVVSDTLTPNQELALILTYSNIIPDYYPAHRFKKAIKEFENSPIR